MVIKYLNKKLLFSICCLISIISYTQLNAQVQGSQQQQIKWVRVSSLQQWFSSGGAEIEYGRRGRTGFQGVDQLDGLIWPGEYTVNKGVNTGKSLWIGTTNFVDPVSGVNYAYKVVNAGRLNLNLGTEIIADGLKMYGRSKHPSVTVDDNSASDLDLDDRVDEIDPNLISDRMIVNQFHTSIGISVTRKIIAFTQQYNDNYFIYEYTFKNTGIIDMTGQKKLNKKLTGVIFHWQYRYGFAGESYPQGWSPTGASWGLNTINDALDTKHPGTAPNNFRAIWSYYGPTSNSPGWDEDVGLPRHTDGSILAGTNYAGVVVLHADKSATDHSDDPLQPTTTQFMPSDRGAQGVDQYDPALMTRKYTEFMNAGQPDQTHAQQVGHTFANTWGGDAGGYAAAQGFGPYDLEPGDSIKIVVAEAVAGIMNRRDLVREIANKWFNNTQPFVLPDGSTTTDRNTYKNTWVFSGKDSLFQSFRRAIQTYNNGNYTIAQPPPPPSEFKVSSGGNRISLVWSNSAESWPNFNGYRIFRAVGKPDTTYDLIFSCDKANAVNSFDDKTPRRGFNYFYYIQTKDDGSTNTVQPGVPLVSSKFYTMTNVEAFLTRPSGSKLEEIRVVPNPYNINASSLQFGEASSDRLAFFGLPPACKIKIYTETGDLIETIDHTNGSGDELWHSLTSNRQLVVSGLYIAYFEVPYDILDDAGHVQFKAGENIIRKFIIIR